MKRHTLLYLIESDEAGGAESVVANLVKSLDSRRYRILLGVSLDAQWLLNTLRHQLVEVRHFHRRRVYDVRFLTDICSTIRRDGVDLIHSHMFTMNFYGTLAGAVTRRPVIITVHDRIYDLQKLKRIWAYRIIGRLASRTVAVSDDILNLLSTHIRLPRRKVELIYNGIDTTRFRAAMDPRAAKQRLGIPAEALVIGTVGLFHAVKGHAYLLKATSHLLSRFSDCYLVLVGDGPMRAELKRLGESLGISKRVIFTGMSDEVPMALSAMDVYAVVSTSEGLSMALLEAMAMGRPVVATNVGGNGEIIVDGENGLLVPPGDSNLLAEKLQSLLQDRELRQSIGENARRIVLERFSVERMAQSHEELYALLGANHAGCGSP